MRDAEPASQSFESRIVHLVQVADRAVGNGSHAAQRAMGVAVDFAPKRADNPRFVQVLQDDNFWARRRGDVATVLAPGVRVRLLMFRIARLNNRSEEHTSELQSRL